MPPCKPVDFTVRSVDGLGDLDCIPREVRNMIYSSLARQIMPRGFEHSTIDRFLVRELMNAPILATSKQLCVEFLEVFIREVTLEEDDDLNEDPRHHDGYYDESNEHTRRESDRHPNCLERLLSFIDSRVNYAFSTKRIGIVINTVYLIEGLMKHLDESGVGDTHKLPRPLQRLWDIHEEYRIPSDQIYIKIDYWYPSAWIRVAGSINQRFTNEVSPPKSHDPDTTVAF